MKTHWINAHHDINEGLAEVYLTDDDTRAYLAWEYDRQVELMNNNQHTLRAALNFLCHPLTDQDEWGDTYTIWFKDNARVAYVDYDGSILIHPKHHELVWSAFNLFL